MLFNNDKIELGKKYCDKVTGFTGVATSRHEYLNGCVRVSLTPTTLKDGKTIEPESFDVQQLEFVDDGVLAKPKKTGGPGDVPKPLFEPKG